MERLCQSDCHRFHFIEVGSDEKTGMCQPTALQTAAEGFRYDLLIGEG